MAIDHVKSSIITNADAKPALASTAGEGGPAPLKNVSSGPVVAVAASSTGATYQFVRVPSNCKIKRIEMESAAQGAGTMDIGLYHSTDGQGGKPLSLLVANAISANLFATGVSLASATPPTNITNQSGNYTMVKRNQPLWQAAGLTADPGGSFDIVGTVGGTAITTGTGAMGMSVDFTD